MRAKQEGKLNKHLRSLPESVTWIISPHLFQVILQTPSFKQIGIFYFLNALILYATAFENPIFYISYLIELNTYRIVKLFFHCENIVWTCGSMKYCKKKKIYILWMAFAILHDQSNYFNFYTCGLFSRIWACIPPCIFHFVVKIVI